MDTCGDLTVSALTLGNARFEERVLASAQAGFSGIGLSVEAYVADRGSGLSDDRMKAILREHGVRLSEVEFLSTWAMPASVDQVVSDEKEATAFHIARTFDADRINAGLFGDLPVAVMGRSFRALCDRAGDVRIALEFMPFGAIPDLATAWEVLSWADPPNGGLLIDVWHWVRSGMTSEDLGSIAADRVHAIQVCDVGQYPLPEPRHESLHHRVVPGQGFGGVSEVLRVFAVGGLSCPISAEVMSDELLAKGLSFTASAVFAGVQDVIGDSGYHCL